MAVDIVTKPKSILSFCYHVIHDEDTRDAVLADMEAVMQKFGLSNAERQAARLVRQNTALSTAAKEAAIRDFVQNHLLPFLLSHDAQHESLVW